MIEVKLLFSTVAEAVAFLAGSPAAPSASITPDKQEAARASTAAGKTAKAETATPPADDGKAAAEALTKLRTDTSAKIVKLAGLNQDAAIALLASFDAKRAKELKDDQLADAMVAVDKALALADMG